MEGNCLLLCATTRSLSSLPRFAIENAAPFEENLCVILNGFFQSDERLASTSIQCSFRVEVFLHGDPFWAGYYQPDGITESIPGFHWAPIIPSVEKAILSGFGSISVMPSLEMDDEDAFDAEPGDGGAVLPLVGGL